jgi:hypothetical protein
VEEEKKKKGRDEGQRALKYLDRRRLPRPPIEGKVRSF